MLNTQYLSILQNQLAQFATQSNFELVLTTAFGSNYDLDLLQDLRRQWLNGDFTIIPEIEILSNGELGTANGAYSAERNRIFVSSKFLYQSSSAGVAELLLEEVGHRIDRFLNSQLDSAGDEGEIFRLLVSGYDLSPDLLTKIKTEDDHGVIDIGDALISIEKQDFVGSNGDNFFVGTSGADTFTSFAGQDSLLGGAGDDFYIINADTDYGIDIIAETTGIDRIDFSSSTVAINLNLSNSLTQTIAPNVQIANTASYASYFYLFLGFGNGSIAGVTAIENILGGSGNDTFYGNALGNFIGGGGGNDTIIGFGGNDILFGGDGNDSLSGLDGNDYLLGGSGNDTLIGAIGYDTLIGLDGNDLLIADGVNDTYLNGAKGDDIYEISDGSSGLITIIEDIGGGTDTIRLTHSPINGNTPSNFSINLTSNVDQNILPVGLQLAAISGQDIENVYGGDGNDYIVGNSLNNDLYGGDGNDFISGYSGTFDNIYGGNGQDTLHGYTLSDYISGDNGNDYIEGFGTLIGGSGSDTITGSAHSTTNNNFIYGGDGSDLLQGASGAINIIYGDSGDDTLIASSYFSNGDYLNGGTGKDLLYGWFGNDTLDGGSGANNLKGDYGNDTYVVRSDSGGTVISDIYGNADTLQLSNDVSLSNLRKSGTSLLVDLDNNNLVNSVDDLTILNFFRSSATSSQAGDGFIENIGGLTGNEIIDHFRIAKNDFGHDWKSDILWRNTSGEVYAYQMNGFNVASEVSLGFVSNNWTIYGTGDFNGDSKADILWRNSSGLISTWLMDGNNKIGSVDIRTVGNQWKIAGTADFNGDRLADILWRNINTGEAYIYEVNTNLPNSILSEGSVRFVGNDWNVAGTGDFNGDGKSDILWRNNSGLTYAYLMDGKSVIDEGIVRGVSNDWVIEGVDDFNADGKSDIIWRNTNSGQVYLYQMDGTYVLNEGVVGSASADWNIAGTGDYNGDTKADILWRNDSGLTYLWTMDGFNQNLLYQNTIRQVDNSWQIAAPTI
jgi:Ca2+-binding RTX toxin-like protein